MKNELLKSLVVLLLHRAYFQHDREKFEWVVMNLKTDDKLIPMQQRKAVLKHFKTQVYPVKNEIILWMRSNLKKEYDELDGINFYDRYKELKKLFE